MGHRVDGMFEAKFRDAFGCGVFQGLLFSRQSRHVRRVTMRVEPDDMAGARERLNVEEGKPVSLGGPFTIRLSF